MLMERRMKVPSCWVNVEEVRIQLNLSLIPFVVQYHVALMYPSSLLVCGFTTVLVFSPLSLVSHSAPLFRLTLLYSTLTGPSSCRPILIQTGLTSFRTNIHQSPSITHYN